jgi:hypothetical protein
MTDYETAMLLTAKAQLDLLHCIASDQPLFEATNRLNDWKIALIDRAPSAADYLGLSDPRPPKDG